MIMERWAVLVPYGVIGHLYRGHPGGERVLPGAFTTAIVHHAARLVPMALVDGHHRTSLAAGRRLGLVVELADRAEGLAGLVRFDNTPAGRAGWVRSETEGLSAEYLATRERYAGGVREVLAAQLHRVALTPRPAYRGAAFMIINETAARRP